MDTAYSALLLAAIAAGLRAIQRFAGRGRDAACRRLAALALAAGLSSLAVHFVFGHGAASPEPMRGLEFLENHPAFAGVLLLVIAAWRPWRRPQVGRPGRPPGAR